MKSQAARSGRIQALLRAAGWSRRKPVRGVEGARLPLAPLQPYPSRNTDTETPGLARGGPHSCPALPRGAAGSRLSSLAGPLTPKAHFSVALPAAVRGCRQPAPWTCERAQELPSSGFRRWPGTRSRHLGWRRDGTTPRTNFLTKDSPHLTISFPSATALTCCLFKTVSSVV